MEVYWPTVPTESTVVLAQEPLWSVAYLRSPLVMSWYEMCTASLESMAMDVRDPTFPTESIVLMVQDVAIPPTIIDVHEEEHLAYFRSSLVESRYEMCSASLESTAIELYLPTSPLTSMMTFAQDVVDEQEEEHVAYFSSFCRHHNHSRKYALHRWNLQRLRNESLLPHYHLQSYSPMNHSYRLHT